jgi:hypothetical protein
MFLVTSNTARAIGAVITMAATSRRTRFYPCCGGRSQSPGRSSRHLVRAKPGLVRLGGTADLRGDEDASLHFLDACIASAAESMTCRRKCQPQL